MVLWDVHWFDVALRKESVDRNQQSRNSQNIKRRSLSARRAWIEIVDYIIDYVNDAVALRKESVDRNLLFRAAVGSRITSLSARRAWIEMIVAYDNGNAVEGRSPQGERG